MQENKDRDYSGDPSQVSESGEGDSSAVLLNSSKLRTKLDKLAKWRIDPSLIEFPEDTPEFRGGYATVSRALLASSSGTEGVRNGPAYTTDEHPDPDSGNPHSQNDTPERGFDQQGEDEEVDSRITEKDHMEEERRNASDTREEQPESYRPPSTPKVDDEPESSEHSAREDPDSGDRNAQPQQDIQGPGDDDQGEGEGIDSHTMDGDNDETQEEGRDDFNNNEEQKSHPQASAPTFEDGSSSSEHTADKNLGSGSPSPQPQSDTQEPGDGQQPSDAGAGGPIADGEKDQTKEEQKSDRQTSEPKIVAIKKLKVEEDTDSKRVLGLALRESEFLVGLSHPNIVKFEGFVEDLSTQKVWLIFPWEEHGNLRDFLASGEWEIPERISLINDVTLGLEYLHGQQQPIYHGDLKSLNILVNSEFHALITDFGSARHLGSDYVSKQPKENNHKPPLATDPNAGEEHITLGAFFSATATTLTLTGSSYTLRWAAPELLQEDKPCLRSDIWSLGWIAYEVMTNTIPFHDIKKDAIVINRVIQGQLPSVTEDARMSLIRALCSLMVRCWSIDPDKRPAAEECRKLISWMPMIVPAQTITVDEEASQLRHAQLLNKLGNMYKQQADYISAIRCFTEALNIYLSNGESKGRAETLCHLAGVHSFRNDFTEAVLLFSEALQISTNLGDESGRSTALWGLAQIHQARDEYDEAAELYSEYLSICTDAGRTRDRALAQWGLASVHRSRAQYSEALNLYSEALKIYTEVGDQRERGATLWGLAEVHRMQNEYDEAIKLYLEATQILTAIGDKHWEGEALVSLAQAYQMQNHHSEAISFYTRASEVLGEIGESRRASEVLENAVAIRNRLESAEEGFAETADVETKFLLTSEQI